MPRPSDIVDFLPARVDGVARRDLEQRLKRLRAARLYPPARAVGDRKAEPVNDQYMANLFLALAGSAEAKYCAEAVQRLYDLPWSAKVPVKNQKATAFLHVAGGTAVTFGNLILSEIRGARRGNTPVVEEVLVVDGEADATVGLRAPKETVQETFAEVIIFGGGSLRQTKREITIRLSDGVIQALADFLGPIEDSAE